MIYKTEMLITLWRENIMRTSHLKQQPGGMRTPIALHYGSVIFNMAVKVAETGWFWLNIRDHLKQGINGPKWILPFAGGCL